jgi:predicted Zn-dependent peptidase
MRITKKIKTNTLSALLAIVSASLFVVPAAFAQGGMTQQSQPSTTKGAVIKGKAPVAKNVLRVKLPKAQETTLKNGLRVVVLESDHRLPTFSMEMVVMSGGLSDPADMRGLASATAAMLRDGTAKHSRKELAEQLDTLGLNLGGNSALSGFTTNVTTGGLVENFDQALDTFAEVIRWPSFPAEEVDRYKSTTVRGQQNIRAQPGFLAQERLYQAIYGSHPASLVVAPADAIKKFTSADLRRFHDENYLPNNSILAIAGDVRLKDILPKIEKAFGDWKSGAVTAATIPAVPSQGPTRIYLIDRPGSVQTVFQIGSLGIERTNPDYVALSIMNRILGGGPSSRLFLNIREDKGYTYSVGSNISSSRYPGLFIAQSPVRTDVTEGTLREFMNEFKRIREERVSPQELENAKRSIVGSFALSLENPQALLGNIITQKLYNFSADYWDTYPQKVEAVTAEDIQRVAQKYIDTSHLQIVAVTDASKARDALAKFGEVEIYNADGKRVTAAKN